MNLDGTGLTILIDVPSGGALGIDYHHRCGTSSIVMNDIIIMFIVLYIFLLQLSRDYMFWSDVVTGEISRAKLNGTEVTVLLNDSLEVVGK